MILKEILASVRCEGEWERRERTAGWGRMLKVCSFLSLFWFDEGDMIAVVVVNRSSMKSRLRVLCVECTLGLLLLDIPSGTLLYD